LREKAGSGSVLNPMQIHSTTINGRKPWDGGLLQGVYGCPARWSGRGILTRDSDFLEKRKEIRIVLSSWVQIRTEIKSWIRIQIRLRIEANSDPQHYNY
jgi:hypothetical protein